MKYINIAPFVKRKWTVIMYFPAAFTSEVRAETSGFVSCPLCHHK